MAVAVAVAAMAGEEVTEEHMAAAALEAAGVSEGAAAAVGALLGAWAMDFMPLTGPERCRT
jgi:hypothetical protein